MLGTHPILPVTFAFLCMIAARADARTWSDRTGRQFDGDFAGLVDGKVSIKRSIDGIVFRVPIERLSDADQAFAKSRSQPDTNSANSAGLERWQIDPTAFARMFFGDNLEQRNDSSGVVLKKPEVTKQIDQKLVAWIGLVTKSPLKTSDKKALVFPFSKTGTILVAAGGREVDGKSTELQDMINPLAEDTHVLATFTLAPDAQLGLTAMITGNGCPTIILLAENLKLDPIKILAKIQNEKTAGLAPTEGLTGDREVRISNPNAFSVSVSLRSNGKSADFTVPRFGSSAARVPDGHFDIFFQYSSEPGALYQGDPFTIDANSVEIQLLRATDGNFGIRRVR